MNEMIFLAGALVLIWLSVSMAQVWDCADAKGNAKLPPAP
jgi:threonine/homoserine/homoserine lactone efflux protein